MKSRALIVIFGLSLSLNVSISEAAVSCGISSTGLFFGSINPLSVEYINSTSTINLSCAGGPVSYTVKLTSGYGTILQRLMKNGSNVLKYNLYTSNSYSTILGDGTAGSETINGTSVTDSMDVFYIAYGRISKTGLSSTVAGTYTDSISVTVVY